jgi:murein DD-endopeptidase MepM/ murein hydrolase activator NlpD
MLALLLAGPHMGCDSISADWPTPGLASQQTLAATFGPRRQGSGDRYDFHRGADILVPKGSPVRSIAPGVVDVAGDDPDYDANTVRVMHCRDEPPPTNIENCQASFFTHYSHLSEIHVRTGQSLSVGSRIGSSGMGSSGIEHLHFELRMDEGHKADAEHPLRFLPYEDSGPPSVTIDAVDFSDPTAISVSVSAASLASELDLVRVEVELVRLDDGSLLSSQNYDYEEWNRLYADLLDDPTIENVIVDPENFNGQDPSYAVHFQFHGLSTQLARDQVRVVARATDVSGNSAEVTD